jgi:hypothetical protein
MKPKSLLLLLLLFLTACEQHTLVVVTRVSHTPTLTVPPTSGPPPVPSRHPTAAPAPGCSARRVYPTTRDTGASRGPRRRAGA